VIAARERDELTIDELNTVSGGEVVFSTTIAGITSGLSDDGSHFVKWSGVDGTTYILNSKSGFHQF
jgi:bacteriocin-like protein